MISKKQNVISQEIQQHLDRLFDMAMDCSGAENPSERTLRYVRVYGNAIKNRCPGDKGISEHIDKLIEMSTENDGLITIYEADEK